ncbi:MAG: YjcQ family protein [Eubacteriaceae bacterium]|nr:YjcQ family protein [Eubacteriaceae bacterium]
MAKDDYYVIVYKIMAYLYIQLKAGEPVDTDMIRYDGKLFNINERYWTYIMRHMMEQHFVEGLSVTTAYGKTVMIGCLEDCQITPDGIDYLCNHSLMQKAKAFLKDIKEITPFI